MPPRALTRTLRTPMQAVRAMGLQARLGDSLRARVAGPDADAAARRIWGTPGERWFAEGDPIWRVHGDAAMFPGGIAALLLQSLHPSAMAGVAGHSGFRGDPWGRLQRTSHYLATTTYGTISHAEQMIAAVRQAHAGVRGVDERGVPYAADDPHLLRWVHVAEIWCFLRAHQLYGAEPLTPAEADRYVAQTTVPAERLGVTGAPLTVAELEEQLQAYRPELGATDAARDAATFLLREPPLPVVARGPYGALAAGGLAVLPTWAGRMLDLPAAGGVTRSGARRVGAGATGLVRWGMAGSPRPGAA